MAIPGLSSFLIEKGSSRPPVASIHCSDLEIQKEMEGQDLIEETELIFMGTGSSGGTPKLSCLTKTTGERCETCFSAQNPKDPNNRRNTSAIIRTRWYHVRESFSNVASEGAKR